MYQIKETIQINIVKFLISEEQKRKMQDFTVITVFRPTIKALDKAISWRTEEDQKKKRRNYAIENRHHRRSKGRKVLKWTKQAVSGYPSRGNIPEYPVRKSPSSPQAVQIIALFYNFCFRSFPLCSRTRLFNNNIQSKDIVINIFRQLFWNGSWKYGNGRREIESEIRWKSDHRDRRIQRNWWRSSQGIW